MLENKIRQFWQRLRQHPLFGTRVENLILAVLFVGLLMTLVSHFRAEDHGVTVAPAAEEDPLSVDELLPEGYVLLPMEFVNQAALDPLIGTHAIVNIYRTGFDGNSRGRLVAKNVRVMRAPQNPQTMAALIPENQVTAMMDTQSGYYGVLQRKDPDRQVQIHSARPKLPSLRIEQFEN